MERKKGTEGNGQDRPPNGLSLLRWEGSVRQDCGLHPAPLLRASEGTGLSHICLGAVRGEETFLNERLL